MLLSKNSVKKANMKINFLIDKVNIFGREVDLKVISSGYYAVPIRESCKELDSDLQFTRITINLNFFDNWYNSKKIQ